MLVGATVAVRVRFLLESGKVVVVPSACSTTASPSDSRRGRSPPGFAATGCLSCTLCCCCCCCCCWLLLLLLLLCFVGAAPSVPCGVGVGCGAAAVDDALDRLEGRGCCCCGFVFSCCVEEALPLLLLLLLRCLARSRRHCPIARHHRNV